MKIEEVKKLPPFERLLYWITERYHIWFLKEKTNTPKPWADDTILQQYRFCNVYRERDTVTKWISDNWRTPYTSDPNLWFAMCLARLINLPECLKELEYPTTWDPVRFIHIMHSRRERGFNTFNAAYIVSTNGKKMDKAVYLANEVLSPLWCNRENLRPKLGDTLAQFAKRLQGHIGMGTFLSAQVVADLKYAEKTPLNSAGDWWMWAAPGPGSQRGLNRVLGRHPQMSWKQGEWLKALQHLRSRVLPELPKDMTKLHAQDLQNCLCELDKYERALWGEGTPKQKYPGTGAKK